MRDQSKTRPIKIRVLKALKITGKVKTAVSITRKMHLHFVFTRFTYLVLRRLILVLQQYYILKYNLVQLIYISIAHSLPY
jgi:hypothetical protein